MKPVIQTDLYTAYFTNKQDGNVDVRFSEDAISNRDVILGALRIAGAAWMKAQGELGFKDISDQENSESWDEYIVDALIARASNGQALALYPADCIPLVISVARKDLLILVHIGRRNAEAGVIKLLFDYLLKAHGVRASETEVFAGPSIRQGSYFFKTIDDGQQTDSRWRGHIERKDGLYYIDLLGFTLDRLAEAGVRNSAITVSDIDTGSDTRYFSHARSIKTGETEGRNMFIIKPKEK